MGGVKADLRNKGAKDFLPAVIDNIVSRSEAMVLDGNGRQRNSLSATIVVESLASYKKVLERA